MSSILSLADVGYRQLGPLAGPDGRLESGCLAEIMTRCSDYEAAGPWIRRRARKRGGRLQESIKVQAVFDAQSDLAAEQFDFIEEYFRDPELIRAEQRRVTTESEVLQDLVSTAAKGECRRRDMYRFVQALCLAGPQRLRPLLREYVAPSFFKLYPNGRIVILRYCTDNDDAAAAMRALYAGTQSPVTEISGRNFAGIRTLQEWHLNSAIQIGPLFLNLFNYLFYPFVAGYRGGPPGLDFLFLFEPAEKYEPEPYPRNWLAVASSAASFGRERVDFYAALTDFQGPDWQHASHQRVQLVRRLVIQGLMKPLVIVKEKVP
jgi:hypothetical protein